MILTLLSERTFNVEILLDHLKDSADIVGMHFASSTGEKPYLVLGNQNLDEESKLSNWIICISPGVLSNTEGLIGFCYFVTLLLSINISSVGSAKRPRKRPLKKNMREVCLFLNADVFVVFLGQWMEESPRNSEVNFMVPGRGVQPLAGAPNASRLGWLGTCITHARTPPVTLYAVRRGN